MGPLIDAAAVENFRNAVAEAVAAGGRIVCGGKVRAGPGFWVEPTIVANARNDWPVVQRETFAPILYVIGFDTLAEAIALNNDVPQGLSSAMFTQDMRAAEAGSDAWKAYMRRQTNTINASRELPLAQGIRFGGS